MNTLDKTASFMIYVNGDCRRFSKTVAEHFSKTVIFEKFQVEYVFIDILLVKLYFAYRSLSKTVLNTLVKL